MRKPTQSSTMGLRAAYLAALDFLASYVASQLHGRWLF